MPSGEIIVPGITDAERLQGFEADWTLLDADGPRVRDGHRWKLVGNAVDTRMSSWIGERLCTPTPYDDRHDTELSRSDRWPSAAWGKDGRVYRTEISQWPVNDPYEDLPITWKTAGCCPYARQQVSFAEPSEALFAFRKASWRPSGNTLNG
jgi:DNA (cytosine-5)-methyltransferase 1